MTSSKQLDWVYRPLLHFIYEPIRRAGLFIYYRVFNLAFWQELGSDMTQYYRSFFSDSPQGKRRTADVFYLILPFVVFGLLVLACWRLLSMLLSKRKRAGEDMRRRITIEFYLRMERMLAKIGLVRGLSLTPLEFARRTSMESSLSSLMLPIVEAFYRVRFGGIILSDEESQSVLQTLDRLEQLLLERKDKKSQKLTEPAA